MTVDPSSRHRKSLLRRHPVWTGVGMAFASYVAIPGPLIVWPGTAGEVGAGFLLLVATMSLCYVVAAPLVTSEMVSSWPRAMTVALFGMAVVFVFPSASELLVTQSAHAALRPLPLFYGEAIDTFGPGIFLLALIVVPSLQFRLKKRVIGWCEAKQWDAIDRCLSRWLPRICVGPVCFVMLLLHWAGPLSSVPLTSLAIVSLVSGTVLPPVLRPVTDHILEGGLDNVFDGPGAWANAVKQEFSREGHAVLDHYWVIARKAYEDAVGQYGSEAKAQRALKRGPLQPWIAHQRKLYKRKRGRLPSWKIVALEQTNGWHW